MGERHDVIVVGGGLIGVALACRLARLGGGRIALFERDSLAAGASARSCGMVGAATAMPALTARGLAMLADAEETFGVADIGFVRSGHLTLATDAVAAAALEGEAAVLAAAGAEARLLTAAEAAALDPWLAVDDVAVALSLPAGGYLEVFTAARRIAEAAREAGVTLVENRAVLGLYREGGRVGGIETALGPVAAEAVALTLGPWTAAFPEPLPLAVAARRHVVATIRPEAIYDPASPVVAERGGAPGITYRPTHDGVVRVAAMAPGAPLASPDEIEDVVGGDEIAALAERFARRFPGAADAVFTQASVGALAVTADGLPVIGALAEGLHVACGFAGAGVGPGLAAAEALARAILGGKAPPATFAPGRFAAQPETSAETTRR